MQSRFNIALLPLNPELQILLEEFSNHHFGYEQDGYILGKDSLAHVTLCQFRASHEAEALALYTKWLDRNSNLSFQIEALRCRSGKEQHAGKFWIEFLTERAKALLELQASCVRHLKSHNLEVFTPVETYSPHLTLARLDYEPRSLPLCKNLQLQEPINFHTSVGIATENGVFVKALA